MLDENTQKNEEDIDEIVIEEEFTPDLAKKLRGELKKCVAEKQEYLAGWQRAKADFVNARKEEQENRKDFLKYCEGTLLYEFLNIADSFDGLLKNKKEFEKIDKNWQMGIKNIHTQLMNILKGRGVEIINCSEKKFDPKFHESIGEEIVDTEEKEDIIIDEIRKGYLLNGKVLRPSQVRVGKLKV